MGTVKIDRYNAIITESIINPKSNFIITGYWWGKGNTNRNSRELMTYDQLANRLMNDCKKYNVNCILIEIPEFAVPGGYQFAINFKPTFIKYMVNAYPEKFIVTIDTDMTIKKYPSLFDLDYDFMGYNWNAEIRGMFGLMECYAPYTLHTSGGILGFRKSEIVNKLLDEWEKYSKKYPGKAEDRTMSAAFNAEPYLSQLRCLWLPMEYFIIPYFYEIKNQLTTLPEAKKFFTSRRIKFDRDGYTQKEYFPVKFYNIRKNDYVVIHPEKLTDEEMAHQQGADPNRVPNEWYLYQGLKRRCLQPTRKIVINPTLYLNTKKQIYDLKSANEMLEDAGFIKYSDKKMKIINKPITYRTRRNVTGKDIIISCVSDSKIAEKLEKRLKKSGNNYVLYIGKGIEKYKPYCILNTMRKYPGSRILYLGESLTIKGSFKSLFLDFYEFACVNASAYPVYKPRFVKKRCNDPRILQCLTTEIMMFRDTEFTRNLLIVWDNEIKRGDDRYALTVAYNKYQAVLWTRSFWLDPSYFVPRNNVFIKGFTPSKVKIQSDIELETWDKKTDIYDYLAQCGEKPRLKEEEYIPKTYYHGSAMKKYKYKYLYK